MSITPILNLSGERPNLLTRVSEAFLREAEALVFLIAREVRTRRDMRRLAELDDAMLRDIGIARAEIERAVRIGRGSGPPE